MCPQRLQHRRCDQEDRGLADLLARDGDGYAEFVGALRDPRRERMETRLARGDGSPFRAEIAVSRAKRQGRFTYTLIVRERAG